MSTSPMTTVDRLRQAIAETLSIDAQGLQAAIGQLVVAASADYPAAGPQERSLHSAEVRTTVLLADRIPAGQEAQALAQEIARHHGQEAAQAVLGERAAELLGGDGKVSNYIEQTALSQDKPAGLRALNCAASLSNGLLTLEDGTSVELADLVDFVKGVASKVIPSSNDAEHDLLVEVIGEAGAVLNQSGVRRILSNYIDHPASGKTGTFAAKYDQHAERNGQTFTVLGAVDPKTYDATECGEMFSIRFADGVQIDAWPEEVESAMNEARLVNNDEEVVVKLADGCTLRSGVYDPHKEGALTSGEYVRLCGPDGEEILYWDQEEWANDPALVMGAIMNAAAGLRVHHVYSPSPGM